MVFPTKKDLQGAWQKLLQTLGFTDKVKNKEMTKEDWATFGAAFEKEHGISIQAAFDETSNKPSVTDVNITDVMKEEIQGSIQAACDNAGVETPTLDMSSLGSTLASMLGVMEAMGNNMAEMSKKPEQANPIATVGAVQDPSLMARVLGHSPHTNAHLFGIEEKYFALGTPQTDITVTRKAKGDYSREEMGALQASFNAFCTDFKEHFGSRVDNNQIGLLDYNKMIKGESSIDYNPVNTKFGEHSVRRFDMIIAYLRTLKSVSNIFPVISNVQNEAKIVTASFGELSQGHLAGHNYKGLAAFDGEVYRVNKVMFKFAIEDPKVLEEAYIGYMNQNGSNPMKWHFFEWLIVHFGTVLFNEEQRRRVVGHYAPRQGKFPNPAMLAADGTLRAIQRSEEELKVLPFRDLGVYDRTTILDYVRRFWEYVVEILPNMEGMRLRVNEKHQLWYIDAYDAKYHGNNDYTGPSSDIRYYSPKDIIWVPNMEINDYKMSITTFDNIANLEDKPNEMYAFYHQQDLEQFILASWWKGGSSVLVPGLPFASIEEFEKSDRKLQNLFTNYPVTKLDPDATTINGSLNREYLTGVNTATTEITDIKNPVIERVLTIICGDITDATTIKKAGKFAKIKADWKGVKVGDFIKLYPELHEVVKTIGGKDIKVVEPTGNWLELDRKAY